MNAPLLDPYTIDCSAWYTLDGSTIAADDITTTAGTMTVDGTINGRHYTHTIVDDPSYTWLGDRTRIGFDNPTCQEATVENPGDFILVDGDGVVQNKTYAKKSKAVKAAKRFAGKYDNEYYVYAPIKKFGPLYDVVEEDLA